MKRTYYRDTVKKLGRRTTSKFKPLGWYCPQCGHIIYTDPEMKMRTEFEPDKIDDLSNWYWCETCNSKHKKGSKLDGKHRVISMERHSDKQHFWKSIGSFTGDEKDIIEVENGKEIEAGYPWYGIDGCVVCGRTRKVKLGWR